MVMAIRESHHELRSLAQTIQKGVNQVANVLSIVGGEGVFISFNGCQGETLALELSSSVGNINRGKN